jgi:hypothetical protein
MWQNRVDLNDNLEVVYVVDVGVYVRWWAEDDYMVVTKPTSGFFPTALTMPNNWMLA